MEISKPKILIAEDIRTISNRISWIVEDNGYDARIAMDGEMCLEVAREYRPNLIILDLMMPKLHGIDVLKALKADPDFSEIRIIVCTAKGFKTEIDRALELGADDVIIKPVDGDDLVMRITKQIGAGIAGNRAGRAAAAVAEAMSESGIRYIPTLDRSRHSLWFWGTRGSIPTSGPQYSRHGGDTSCMELRAGEDVIIFDAGSGIRKLGLELVKEKPRKIHLFITHTHWDHIQGFPFFTPAYLSGHDITIYSARGFSKNLDAIFHGQLDQDYFPVQMDDLHANLTFQYLGDQPIQIGDTRVYWEFMQHPGATVGYKIETNGVKVAYVPDNEFLKGFIGGPFDIDDKSQLMTMYKPIIDFLRDVDILVHEAQYMPGEYMEKIGWGHSSVTNAALLARIVDPKQWYVTHHDPMHTDDFLQDKLNLTLQILGDIGADTRVDHAYDGKVVYLA